jgi:NTE family protein
MNPGDRGIWSGKSCSKAEDASGLPWAGVEFEGLAHIPCLEVLDQLGVRPAAVAGTSMGAIVGALYASGKSGADIRKIVLKNIITEDDGIREILKKKGAILRWLHAIKPSWSGRGMLRADGLVSDLLEMMDADTFEELATPLLVTATDFCTGEQVIFSSGDLVTALKASMSIPGVFVPVEHEGRILVDGGVVNNLPFDILRDKCNFTVAIDVTPRTQAAETDPPNFLEATMGMFDIMIGRMTDQSLERHRPNIYHNPGITGIRILDFEKADKVLEQADSTADEFRLKASALLK